MNREQAKEVLSAFRPGGAEADNALFAEALAEARRDPELSAWLSQEMQLDTAVRRKLAQLSAPADLRAQILSAGAAGAAQRRRRRWALAIAACLVGLVVLGGFWITRPHYNETTAFDVYRKDMAAFLQQFPTLDVETERVAEMREWLSSRHMIARVEIPDQLARFPGIGCRTVTWRGRELALICFMVNGESVHMFVLPRSEFPDAPLQSSPQFLRVNGLSTAAWERGGIGYLVLTKGNEAFLRKSL